MIPLRLSAHLKTQSWFTIALDFAIVVFGVFIGIQVSNWNTDRLEAKQGSVFTQRLKADLRIEAWNYEVLVDYLGDVQNSVDTALSALEGELEISDEQLLIEAYRATQWQGGVRQRATYDELTSTGSIGLIKDASLRNTAVKVYSAPVIDQASADGINVPFRVAFRKSIPVEVQVALGENCGDRFSEVGDMTLIGMQLNYDCETGLTRAQIEHAAQALRNHPDLIELLRLRAMNIRTQIGNMTYNNQDVRNALQAVANETP